MKFFYSASAMNYGFGYNWHKKYNFPNFHRVTRTLTYNKRRGMPFAILKFNNSVWNRVSLSNIGFYGWIEKYTFYGTHLYKKPLYDIIISLAGNDEEIEEMVDYITNMNFNISGIELNFSCPNVKDFNNKKIPKSHYPLYLKINCNQDPYNYDLNNIAGIRMNSVPGKYWGGWSGKKAQRYNWPKIKIYNYEGLNVAGCSVTSMDDIKYLEEDCGCKDIGLGSILLTDPMLVEGLNLIAITEN